MLNFKKKSMNNYGNETLKKDVSIVCRVIGTVDKALEDGKVNLIEGIGIARDAVGLISVAKTWKDAKNELSELSTSEKSDLISHIEKEFELRNDVAEKFVETALQVIISLGAALTAQKAA